MQIKLSSHQITVTAFVLLLSCLPLLQYCSKPAPVEVDLAPTVQLLSPKDSSVIVYTFLLKASVTSTNPITHVDFVVDNQIVGTDSTAPYSYLWYPYFFADNNVHYMYVQATDNSGHVGKSKAINILVENSSSIALNVYLPKNPSVIRNSSQVTCIWQKIEDAIKYQIQFSQTMGFQIVSLTQTTQDTTYTSPSLNQTIYYWRVRAADNDTSWGPWSIVSQFTLDGPLPPTLLFPASKTFLQTSASTSFGWNSSLYAAQYEVSLININDSTAPAISGISADTNSSFSLPLGAFYWKVRAKNSSGFWGMWGDSISFGYGVFTRSIPTTDPTQQFAVNLIQRPDSGYIVVSSNDLIGLTPTGAFQWDQKINGASFISIGQSASGEFILAGNSFTPSPDHWTIVLMKINSSGTAVSTTSYNDTLSIIGQSIKSCSDGGYIMSATETAPAERIMLYKFDGSGAIEWRKIISDSTAWGISASQTSDGGYIVLGNFLPPSGSLTPDLFLEKTNGTANVIWQQTFSQRFAAYDGLSTPDGGYVTVGYGNPGQFWQKVNSAGQEVWRFRHLENEGSALQSISDSFNGDNIVTGYDQSGGNVNTYVARINTSGAILWEKRFPGGGGKKVIPTFDGGYCIATSTMMLIKTDQNGFTYSP
jgi:Bacterial Ig domain